MGAGDVVTPAGLHRITFASALESVGRLAAHCRSRPMPVGRVGGVMRPVRYTVIDHISAPIDDVFAALTDPHRIERWLPGCAGVAADGPIRKGARLTVQFGRRITELDIVDFSPPRTFGWVERGQRKDYKTFFQLDLTSGATAVTIQEVWTPISIGAWIRGRFFPKRNVQRHQKEILRNLRNILTA